MQSGVGSAGGGGAERDLWSEHFYFQLLSSNVVKDLMLLDLLLDSLAARQKDSCAGVRRLVLRGLANLASCSGEQVSLHPPSLQLGPGLSWGWSPLSVLSPGTGPWLPAPDCYDQRAG